MISGFHNASAVKKAVTQVVIAAFLLLVVFPYYFHIHHAVESGIHHTEAPEQSSEQGSDIHGHLVVDDANHPDVVIK